MFSVGSVVIIKNGAYKDHIGKITNIDEGLYDVEVSVVKGVHTYDVIVRAYEEDLVLVGEGGLF